MARRTLKRVYITLQQIKALDPCADQFHAVRKLFGTRQRMEVTEQRAAALAQRFNFSWLARRTLFGAARAELERADASAWARCYIMQCQV